MPTLDWTAHNLTSELAAAATQWVPQVVELNASLVIYAGLDMPQMAWVSFVDAELDSVPTLGESAPTNPCSSGQVAAAEADNLHSGAIFVNHGAFTIDQSAKSITIPATTVPDGVRTVTLQDSILLDLTRIFTMCYAFETGLPDDPSWRDSYVRLKFKDQTVPSLVTVDPPHAAREVDVNTKVVLKFSESVQAGTGSIHFTPLAGGTPLSVPAADSRQVEFSCSDLLPDCPSLAARGMCTPTIGHIPSYDFSTKVCQKSCTNCTSRNSGGRATDTVTIDLFKHFNTDNTTYAVSVDSTAFKDDALEPNAFEGVSNLQYHFTTKNCHTLCCHHYEYTSQNCTCVPCNTAASLNDPNCQFWNEWKTYQRCVPYLSCYKPKPEGCGPNYFQGWHAYPAYRPQDQRQFLKTNPPVEQEPRTMQMYPTFP